MKRILITGEGSYIGESMKKYLLSFGSEYSADTVTTLDDSWKSTDFGRYDSVYHVAGIAHQKETDENRELYFKVNRDMAVEIARKAKNEGAKQFIFMSSMSVYGMDTGIITPDTVPCPKSAYGKSKLQAEEEINKLADENFKVCVLRPPMIYGKGCRGNFNSVVSIVRKSPIFPKVNNERSSLYIDNLCSFVKKAIDTEMHGLYFPQNKEYMNTASMAKWIGEALGKNVKLSSFAGAMLKLIKFHPTVKKAFGTLKYEGLEKNGFDYCTVSARDSVKKSV